MKKIFKNPLLTFVIGILIAGRIGVYATIRIQASEIDYNGTPVDEVLDDLYSNIPFTTMQSGKTTVQISGDGWQYTTINFPKSFNSIPTVYIKPLDGSGIGSYIRNIDITGFEIGLRPTQWSLSNYDIEWLAFEK